MSTKQLVIDDDELLSRLHSYARELVPFIGNNGNSSGAEVILPLDFNQRVISVKAEGELKLLSAMRRKPTENQILLREPTPLVGVRIVANPKQKGTSMMLRRSTIRGAKPGRKSFPVAVALAVGVGAIGISVVSIQQAADRPKVIIETVQPRGLVIATRVPKRFGAGVRGVMVGPNPAPSIQRSLQLFGPEGQGVAISIWPTNVDEFSLASSTSYDPVRPFAFRSLASGEFVANEESLTVLTGSGQRLNLLHYDEMIRPGTTTRSTNRWAGSLRFDSTNRNHLVVGARANRDVLAKLIRTVRIDSGSLSLAENQLPVGWGVWHSANMKSFPVSKVEYPFGSSEEEGVTVTELSPNTMRFADLSKQKLIEIGSRTIRLFYPDGEYPTVVVTSFQGRTIQVTGSLSEGELVDIAKSLRVASASEEAKLRTRRYVAISDVAVAGNLEGEGILQDGNQWRSTHSNQFGQTQSLSGEKVDLVVGLSQHPGAFFPLAFLDGRGQIGSQFLSPGSVVFAPTQSRPVRAIISRGAKKTYAYFLPALGEKRQVAFFPSIDITRETDLTIETLDSKNPMIPGSRIERG
jgi:hypothetical protein